jgi:hypothetical protein
MGRADKLIDAFIDSIPDDKLTGFLTPGKVFRDRKFRLDMQGINTGGAYKLQVQVNNKPATRSWSRGRRTRVRDPSFAARKNLRPQTRSEPNERP